MSPDSGAEANPTPVLAAAKRRFEAADYAATERLARVALDAAAAAGDVPGGIEARTWLGAGLAQQGQYAVALRWLHEAVDLAQAHGTPRLSGRACNYIAVCHEETGDFQTAVEWYERGIAETRRSGDREVEVYLLSNLADGWVNAGSADRAMPLLDAAVEVARGIGDEAHAAWCLSARARLRDSLGDADSARVDHATAVDAARRSGSERIHAETLRDEGAFLARHGDTGAAIERLERSLAIATGLGIQRETYRAHEALAAVHEQRGEWREALEHHRRFHALHAGVFDEVVKAKLENLNAVSELQRARHQEAIARLRSDALATALGEVERQARELERLSLHDALTGACNRRFLESALAEAWTRARDESQALCVAMIDVDHFKRINDTHGHAVGDDVLCRLARLVEQHLRPGDVLARYGGEEFVLVLPRIAAPQMLARGEAIRVAIASDDWSRIAPGLAVTISVGIAGADEVHDWEGLLALADQRMYRAKRAGRDRVCGPDAASSGGSPAA